MRDDKTGWNGALLAWVRDEALDLGPLLLAGALVIGHQVALVGRRALRAPTPAPARAGGHRGASISALRLR